MLVAFDWKRNNVRELQNAIERAVVAAQGETIRAAELAEQFRQQVKAWKDGTTK